jgi:hypothetical protein
MANFFKKLNHKHSPKSSSPFDSPPVSLLPNPPPLNQLKNGFDKNNIINQNSIEGQKDSILKSGFENSKLNNVKNNQKYDNIVSTLEHNNNNNSINSDDNTFSTPIYNNHNNNNNNTNNNTEITTPEISIKKQNSPSDYQPDKVQTSPVTPWRKKKLYNSPFPRFGHAVSSLTSTSGALYLMGGLSGNEVYGDMWVIEPIRQQENLSSNLIKNSDFPYISSPIENFQKVPSPRTGHSSILIGNAFIIFGGDTAINNEESLDNKLYFFNISSLKWTITNPEGLKPSGRYGTQISVLNIEIQPNNWSSELFVFGGQLNNNYFNDLWKFNLSNFKNPNNKWIKIKPMGEIPPPLTNHSMTAFNENLYVFGGQNSSFINDQLYCYNYLKNEWIICKLNGPSFPPPLYSHSSAIYGSLLFIYGGKLSNDLTSDDFFIIDLSNLNSWKLKNSLLFSPGARYGHSITVNSNDEKILIMGGDIYDNDLSGIEDLSINMVDETKFALPSSVIYECDIKLIEKFIDKPKIKNNSIKDPTKNLNTTFPSNFGHDIINERSRSNINLNDSPELLENSFHASTPLNSDTEDNNLDSIKQNDEIIIDDIIVDIIDDNLKNIPSPEQKLFKKDNNEILKSSNDTIQNNENLTSKIILNATTLNIQNVQNDPILYKTPETIKNDDNNNTDDDDDDDDDDDKNNNKNENDHAAAVVKTTDFADFPPSFATPLTQQAATLPFSPAIAEKDNIKLQRLIQMVNDVKTEMKLSVASANSQIVKLEAEKAQLLEQLKNEKKSINSFSLTEEDLQENDDISSSRTLKLQHFIKNELSTVSELNNLIQTQQENIKLLTERLIGEEPLHDKIFELEAENSSLKNKIENFSILSESLNISPSNIENQNKQLDPVETLSKKLDLLVTKWNINGPHTDSAKYLEDINGLKETNDQLLSQLNDANNKIEEYDILFSESKNSLNKSHKALLLSQSESNKLKNQINLLRNELDDLKLKRRVYSNSNSRIPSASRNISASNTPILKNPSTSSLIRADSSIHSDHSTGISNLKDSTSDENEIENENEDDYDMSFVDERYEIKIKDLEVNLFIVSQERDQIREELNELKKKLYNNMNNSTVLATSSNPS